jgi:hypothetical protein
VPYEDWTPEFQDMWHELPVDMSELEPGQQQYAEYMFEEGFMHYAGEQDPADTQFAREEFFYELGIDEEEYDWAGWREAMGYE